MTRRRGFTLIELLTTVVIISVISTIALPRTRDAVFRAQAARLLEQKIRDLQADLAAHSEHGSAVPANDAEAELTALHTALQQKDGVIAELQAEVASLGSQLGSAAAPRDAAAALTQHIPDALAMAALAKQVAELQLRLELSEGKVEKVCYAPLKDMAC